MLIILLLLRWMLSIMKTSVRNAVLSAGFQSQTRALREVWNLSFYTHRETSPKQLQYLIYGIEGHKYNIICKSWASASLIPDSSAASASPWPRTWPSTSAGQGRADASLRTPISLTALSPVPATSLPAAHQPSSSSEPKPGKELGSLLVQGSSWRGASGAARRAVI